MDFSEGAYVVQKDGAIARVQSEFGYGAGDCVSLDKLIKKVRDKLVAERLKETPVNWDVYGGGLQAYDKMARNSRTVLGLRSYIPMAEYYEQALVDYKTQLEGVFATNNCSDKIESLRQNETAVLITKQAIEQEQSVLGGSEKEQNIYIGIGALTLLVGLLIIVRK
jgi:hypothetical protein